jgi:hypothetical protein
MNIDESTLTILEEALSGLEDRLGKDGWDDNITKSGILKTCEGLEAFLIPLAGLFEYPEAGRMESTNQELRESNILQYVKELLGRLKKEGFAPSPYLDDQLGKEYHPNSDTDFVDTASFVITTVLDLRRYFRKRGKQLDSLLSVELDSELEKGVKFLLESARDEDGRVSWWAGKGATSGHVYFTYTAVIALSQFCESKDRGKADSMLKDVQPLLPKVKSWIMYCHKGNRWPSSERNLSDTHIIYTIYALLSLLALKADKDEDVKPVFRSAVEEIISEWNKGTDPDINNEFFNPVSHRLPFRVGPKTVGYEDRSTLCVGLSALARSYGHAQVDNSALGNATKSMFAYLINERLPDGTWYRPNFEFYYTQRAIEAVTDFGIHIPDVQIKITRKSLMAALLKVLQDPQVLELLVNEIVENAENASDFDERKFIETERELRRAARELRTSQ